jgi:hypothetical protein
MPSNNYSVAGQAALNLVMNAVNDNRLPDTNERRLANMVIGNAIVLYINFHY